jgi:cytidine deaminase
MASAATIDWEPLVAAALGARERAYAEWSGYRVGAALLAADGTVHAAPNVELWIPALGTCAERNAVAAAVGAGQRRFRALAVVTDSSPPAFPCGVCRQVLVEFVPADEDLAILCVNPDGERRQALLSELLPGAFRLSEAQAPPAALPRR